jgi:hypothetical protein
MFYSTWYSTEQYQTLSTVHFTVLVFIYLKIVPIDNQSVGSNPDGTSGKLLEGVKANLETMAGRTSSGVMSVSHGGPLIVSASGINSLTSSQPSFNQLDFCFCFVLMAS